MNVPAVASRLLSNQAPGISAACYRHALLSHVWEAVLKLCFTDHAAQGLVHAIVNIMPAFRHQFVCRTSHAMWPTKG